MGGDITLGLDYYHRLSLAETASFCQRLPSSGRAEFFLAGNARQRDGKPVFERGRRQRGPALFPMQPQRAGPGYPVSDAPGLGVELNEALARALLAIFGVSALAARR